MSRFDRPVQPSRKVMVNVRVTEAEAAHLDELADRLRLENRSGVLRSGLDLLDSLVNLLTCPHFGTADGQDAAMSVAYDLATLAERSGRSEANRAAWLALGAVQDALRDRDEAKAKAAACPSEAER